MHNQDKHQQYMSHALELAARGRGSTSPNPMVGAVIVKRGRIIGEGWHKRAGLDHAEIAAIKNARESVKGSTIYINLEPCHHFGRTPPCVDALITHGFKQVVIAVPDPNPLTAGKSIRKLKRAGIDVVTDVMAPEAEALNEVFFKFITRKMPFVTAKIAQTIDGKIAAANGSSKWITSERTRDYAKSLRKNFDGILVGVNTVLKDNPLLNAPGKLIPFKKIIVDSKLRTPLKARLFENGQACPHVIFAVTSQAPIRKIKQFQSKGSTVIVCPAKNGRVDLKWLFKVLAEKNISSLLIEGGATVISSLIKASLVDRMHMYVAPRIIGDQDALSSVINLGIKDIKKSLKLSFGAVDRIGEDLFIEANLG